MKYLISIFVVMLMLAPITAFAMPDRLQRVYDVRTDLQAAFDINGDAILGSASGFLINFEDWARQYGWRTMPELASYAPAVEPPVRANVEQPLIDAEAWIIVDKNSGKILGANKADQEWPIASITKLVTTDVITKQTNDFEKQWAVRDADNVGGARLYVEDGTSFQVRDLLYATLVGSANNAANAISRSLGVSGPSFVGYMNDRVRMMGLRRTTLVDPTGIEIENVSTAREVAEMARLVFTGNDLVRETTQTVRMSIAGSDGEDRQITTTNWMLYKPQYDDLWVMAGKTGYLHESRWNVVEMLRPSKEAENKELIVVVFGSESRGESFDNVKKLSYWAWNSHSWE
ncbi:D-alanyl-D-alanine carboxypeptidase [Candidatus Uhrbacteria bacterium]|nr:D-alanyl-D-alanine carboxypeptidase [Candidatus Uhrbacteria bacterium]